MINMIRNCKTYNLDYVFLYSRNIVIVCIQNVLYLTYLICLTTTTTTNSIVLAEIAENSSTWLVVNSEAAALGETK